MLLYDIMPCEACSLQMHDKEFMERFWEPIVDAVGHFLVPGDDVIIVSGMSHGSGRYCGFRVDGKESEVGVRLSGSCWWLDSTTLYKTAASRFTEDQLGVGSQVSCTSRGLPSYYGREGYVVDLRRGLIGNVRQVDFGRGLGTIWLREDAIDIVGSVQA